MKNFLLSVLVLFIAGSAFSQTKPVAKDISLGFQITGLSNIAFSEWGTDAFNLPQVLGRYYLSDKIALRARLGVNFNNSTTDFDRTTFQVDGVPNAVRIDSSLRTENSGFVFSISPGVEYHLASEAAKLDPYVAASIPFAIQGPTSSETDIDVAQLDAAGETLYREDVNTKLTADGGISVGLNLIGGFNYFFTPKVAIGAEYAIGFAYNDIGGTVRVAQTGTINNQGSITSVDLNENLQNSTTSLELGVRSTAGVNVSIFW